jgi:hypothetical protein
LDRRGRAGGETKSPDLNRRQFAENRIMLKPIATGFTFRFRKW